MSITKNSGLFSPSPAQSGIAPPGMVPQQAQLDSSSLSGPGGPGGAATAQGAAQAMPVDAQMPQQAGLMQQPPPQQAGLAQDPAAQPQAGPADEQAQNALPLLGGQQPTQPGWQPGVQGQPLYSDGMGPVTGKVPKMAMEMDGQSRGGSLALANGPGRHVNLLRSGNGSAGLSGAPGGSGKQADALSLLGLQQIARKDRKDKGKTAPGFSGDSASETGSPTISKSAEIEIFASHPVRSAAGEGNFKFKTEPWYRDGEDAWPKAEELYTPPSRWDSTVPPRQGNTTTKISESCRGFLRECLDRGMSDQQIQAAAKQASLLSPVVAEDLEPLTKAAIFGRALSALGRFGGRVFGSGAARGAAQQAAKQAPKIRMSPVPAASLKAAPQAASTGARQVAGFRGVPQGVKGMEGMQVAGPGFSVTRGPLVTEAAKAAPGAVEGAGNQLIRHPTLFGAGGQAGRSLAQAPKSTLWGKTKHLGSQWGKNPLAGAIGGSTTGLGIHVINEVTGGHLGDTSNLPLYMAGAGAAVRSPLGRLLPNKIHGIAKQPFTNYSTMFRAGQGKQYTGGPLARRGLAKTTGLVSDIGVFEGMTRGGREVGKLEGQVGLLNDPRKITELIRQHPDKARQMIESVMKNNPDLVKQLPPEIVDSVGKQLMGAEGMTTLNQAADMMLQISGLDPKQVGWDQLGIQQKMQVLQKAGAFKKTQGLINKFNQYGGASAVSGKNFLTPLLGMIGLKPGNPIFDFISKLSGVEAGFMVAGFGSLLAGLISMIMGNKTGAGLGLGGGLLLGGLGMYGNKLPGAAGQFFSGGQAGKAPAAKPPGQQQVSLMQSLPTQQQNIPRGNASGMNELQRSTGIA